MRTLIWIKGGNALEVDRPAIGPTGYREQTVYFSPVKFGSGFMPPGWIRYSAASIDPNAFSLDYWFKASASCVDGYRQGFGAFPFGFWAWYYDASNYISYGYATDVGMTLRLKIFVCAGGTLASTWGPIDGSNWTEGDVVHLGFTFSYSGSGPGKSRVIKFYTNGSLGLGANLPWAADLPLGGGLLYMGVSPDGNFGNFTENYYENVRVEAGARPGVLDKEYADRNRQRAPARDVIIRA